MIERISTSSFDGCTKEEALSLALSADEARLFRSAARIREQHFGDRVEICRIISAKSGNCDMDCVFCSQSSFHSGNIPVHPVPDEDELVERIARCAESGAHHVGLVTSGGALGRGDVEKLCAAARRNSAGAGLCGSLGRLERDSLLALREAGFTRFHHNLETSREHYPSICTTQAWEERLSTIRTARAVGFDVCAGGLFGMGESWEDRISLALSLREEQVCSVPINFLNPRPGTPLEHVPLLDAAQGLRIIAVLRHILPSAILRICGGREQVLGEREGEMFAAGANALMTGDYLTTSGKLPERDMRMIRAAGMRICTEERA